MATRLPAPPEHQVFINGDVLTMDADNRVVEAISLRGDRIEAVGSTAEIMAVADDDTLVVDLRGRTLLPGFIDAHGHFPDSGMTRTARTSTARRSARSRPWCNCWQRLQGRLPGSPGG